ncbi:acyl-ACP--UDP-N-acetylglucosamine O-acyltransferase [bacterium]|nr:acyl-ACP--UDP-N-acetylglucosamine O-acyltransferase [bacterium]
MTDIHSTAIIDSTVQLGAGVSVGPYAVIRGDAVIGDGTQIHAHALVDDGARIGRNCVIHHSAAVSTPPQDLKYKFEKTTLEIGDNTIVREFADLNRGTVHRGKTVIGSNCLLMAYCHTAHDCIVGDNVILANGVQLAGHVTVEDYVILGGLVAVHQFCRVGRHSLIGGVYRAVQDVPPYILAAGEPLSYKGLNAIGLKRRGFSPESVTALRRCYKLIYRSNLNTSQAVAKIRSEMAVTPEIENVLAFIEASERGII